MLYIFKSFEYKIIPELTVHLLLKSPWSLVLTKTLFWLEYISFLLRQLQLIKTFLLTKLQSHILTSNWFDGDFVAAQVAAISWGLSNQHCMVYIYIGLWFYATFAKNPSKKIRFSWSVMFCFFNTMKSKIKNLPLFRIQFTLE